MSSVFSRLLYFLVGLALVSSFQSALAETWSASFPLNGKSCSFGAYDLNPDGLPIPMDSSSSPISRFRVVNAGCGDSTYEEGSIRLMCASYPTDAYIQNIQPKEDGIGTITVSAATYGQRRYMALQSHTPASLQVSTDGRNWTTVGAIHPFGAFSLQALKFNEFRFEINDPTVRYFRLGRLPGPNWPCPSHLSITDLEITAAPAAASLKASKSFVYVLDGIRAQVKKFDTDGKLLLTWGKPDPSRDWSVNHVNVGGLFRLDNPIGSHGLAVDSEGSVYVLDGGMGKIHKFDADGKFLNFVVGEEVCRMQGGRWYRGRIVGQTKVCSRDFPRSGGGGGIAGMAIDSQDNIYVAVKHRKEIQKIDSDGNFVLKFGQHSDSQDWSRRVPPGYFRGSGELRSSGGIAIDSKDRVYVMDGADARIQKFDPSGNFLQVIETPWSCRRNRRWESAEWCGTATGFPADTSPGMQGMAIDSKDNLYVAVGAKHQIYKFDEDGYLIRQWGQEGCGPGEFQRGGSGVSGVAIDDKDHVYVATSGDGCNDHQVQKFDANGKFISSWGGFNKTRGPAGLQGIAVGRGGGDEEELVECEGACPDQFIYVAESGNNRIQKFDLNGKFLEEIGSHGTEDGKFVLPTGIAVTPDGRLLVADTYNHRVQLFDTKGNFAAAWGERGPRSKWWNRGEYGKFSYPQWVTTDAEGNVYTSEYALGRIQKFDSTGKLLLQFGKSGTKDGEFRFPHGIAVDSSGNIYVVDRNNNRIQKFDPAGKFIKKWGSRGSGDGEFYGPMGIAVDSEDNIYVADTANQRIQKFNKFGTYKKSWGWSGGRMDRTYGYAPAGSSKQGEFYLPFDVKVDRDDNLYVTDYRNSRIQKFDADGKFLLTWGAPGRGKGQFNNPHGIAISGALCESRSPPPFIIPQCEDDITGSGAPVSVDARGSGGGTQLFLTQYSARDWTGDLKSFLLKEDGKPGVQTWSAANRLNSQSGPEDARTIVTWGKPPGAVDEVSESAGVAFKWDNLWKSQQQDLATGDDGSCGTVDSGKERLDYVRGDQKNDELRDRDNLLGAIVHSRAIYVADPVVGWPDPSYSKFKAIHKDREPIVYVGANDGMLHGFSAKDGREVIGYVPAAIFSTGAKSGLHYFTSPDFKHEYLVDGTPAISDVFIRSRVSANQEWRTVLLSTLRGGGRGLFAIDVTDPEKFNESSAKSLVLWEFNNSHDEHLGYTFSKPVLARMNNGRWAAILGNGYEDTATDETGGQAQLFIIYLDGGLDGKWTEGTDYHRLTTGVGSPGKRNGLASPAVVDLDGDAYADRVYAGDLEGNMWVFDLSSRIASEWRVKGEGVSRPMPLFRATDSAGNPQPITVEPQVIRQQKFPPSSPPNLMVFFGTGQYMYESDKSTKEPQAFYGVWDRGDLNLTRENLVAQTILVETQRAEGKGRVTDPELEVDYFWIKQRDYGWFLDLPTQGERVVGDPKVRYDTVYFNTLIPDPQSCGFGGTGWMMSVVTFNGGSPPEETPAFDFNEDGIISSAGDTVEFRDERYAYAGKKFEKGGEPTGPSIAATGGNHMRYTVGTETDEAEEVEANLLEKKKGVNGRISWNQLYPVYEPPKQ